MRSSRKQADPNAMDVVCKQPNQTPKTPKPANEQQSDWQTGWELD